MTDCLIHVSTLTKKDLGQNLCLAIRADERAERYMMDVRNLVWALFTVTRFCFPWVSEEDETIRPGSSCGSAHKSGPSCHTSGAWYCWFCLGVVIFTGEELNLLTNIRGWSHQPSDSSPGCIDANNYKASPDKLFSYISSWDCSSGQLAWQTLLLLFLCILTRYTLKMEHGMLIDFDGVHKQWVMMK